MTFKHRDEFLKIHKFFFFISLVVRMKPSHQPEFDKNEVWSVVNEEVHNGEHDRELQEDFQRVDYSEAKIHSLHHGPNFRDVKLRH